MFHGCPAVVPWLSSGCPVVVLWLVVPWLSRDCPSVALRMSVVVPWLSSGCSVVVPWEMQIKIQIELNRIANQYANRDAI